MQYINGYLIVFMLVSLIIMPLVTAEILRVLGNHTKQQLVNTFGINSQVVLGGLGVIIHELSHLIVAKLFFHRIGNFSLLSPKSYKYTGDLGYVRHYWNKSNMYESLGNFFIGLAPCFICSEILWLIHGFLFNNRVYYSNSVNNLSQALRISFNNILHPFGQFSWQLLIYLILIIMIASTGYGLSNADMENTISGLPYWIVFLICIYLIIMFTGTSAWLTLFLWKFIVLWLTFLGRGLIYIITSLLIIDGISLIKR